MAIFLVSDLRPLLLLDGENWFTQRPYLGLIPLTNDLNIATRLLRKFTALQTLLKRKGVGTEIAELVWTRFVRDTQFRDSRVLLGAFRHDDPTDLETLQKVYNSNVTDGRMAASRRSVEWLREFGTCGDHIVGGNQSTLPEAGLGAFASRRLPKGTIVAQLPMIHIPDRRRLQMHKLFQNSEGHWVPENGIVTGHQLLLNYCYGHPQSTMVLCPYGPVTNYLNHNQTLANVRLQWSKASKGNHMPELLDTSVDEIASSDATAKLAMELVALREIQAGEEVFLDYGDEWEAAWTNHVKRWKPVSGAAQYQSAVQLDADHSTRLRTVFEDVDAQSKGKSWMNSFTTSTTTKSMYPDNVELLCDTTCQREPDQMQSHYLNGTLEKYLYESNSEWWPCSVLKYRLDEDNNGEYLYKIHLHQPDSGGFLIDNVPRSIFHFVDKPITSDVFLPNAFRHAIGIPDEMFPEKWRNIQK